MQAERSEGLCIPLQKDPLSKKRNLTDAIFIKLFSFFIIFWIGAVAHIYWPAPWTKTSERVNLTIPKVETSREKQTLFSLFYSVLNTIDKIIDYACVFYRNSFGQILYYMFAGQATLFAFFILVKSLPIFLNLLAILYTLPAFIILLTAVIETLYLENHTLILIAMIAMTVYLSLKLSLLVAECSMKGKLNVDPVMSTVAKGLRSMYQFRSIFYFSFAIVLLIILLMVWTVPALSLLGPRSMLRYFILIGTMYVFSFICSFTNMVISQLVASRHWPPNDGENVKYPMLRCIKIVVRYHFGSIALSATGVFPFCLTIAALFKHKIPGKDYIFFVLKVLIMNNSTYAETLVAIHGYSYLQAIQQTFDSRIKKPVASLHLILILDRRLILSHLVIAFSTLPFFYRFRYGGLSISAFLEKYGYQFVSMLILLSGFATFATMPILSTVNATYVCDLEDAHVEEQSRREVEDVAVAADDSDEPRSHSR